MVVARPLGRLVRDDDFRRVYREGSRRATALLVIHSLPNERGEVRLGLAVSRRAGPAVARNRMRRRVREAVRAYAPRIAGGIDLVVTPRAAAKTAPFAALLEGIGAALAAGGCLRGGAGGGAA